MLTEQEVHTHMMWERDVPLSDAMVMWQGPRRGGGIDTVWVMPQGRAYVDDGWQCLDAAAGIPLKTMGACIVWSVMAPT